MANGVSNHTLRIIFIIAGVLLILGLFTAGFIVPLVAIVLLLLVLGGGAMLYRKAGPPER